MTGLTDTSEYFVMTLGGATYAAAAAEIVRFGVDSADTGTTLVGDVYLLGYLI